MIRSTDLRRKSFRNSFRANVSFVPQYYQKIFSGPFGTCLQKGPPKRGIQAHPLSPFKGGVQDLLERRRRASVLLEGIKRLCSWMCKNVLLRAPRADRYPVPLASKTAWTVKGKRTTTRQVSRPNERQWRCQELRRLQVWWWRYLFTKSFLQPPPDFIDGEFRWAIHHSDKDVFFWGGFCFKFVYPFFGVFNCLHMFFLLM